MRRAARMVTRCRSCNRARAGARRSPACCRAPRSPRRRAPRPTGSSLRRSDAMAKKTRPSARRGSPRLRPDARSGRGRAGAAGRATSPSTTSAITSMMRPTSPTPNMTRCAGAIEASRGSAFPISSPLRLPASRGRRQPRSRNSARSRHRVPMLSLGNAFSDRRGRGFRRPHPPLSQLAETRRWNSPPSPKSTGCRFRLRYEEGRFWSRRRRAATAMRARMSPPISAR